MNLNKQKIEKVFSTSENFDKKNKINRSSKKVNQSTLDAIENGITIEQLETLCKGIPIYKYKTQITIHGLFPELQNSYINRYKCLIQNKNLSIGVRYQAIDSAKKSLIREYASHAGYACHYNSVENYIYLSVAINDKQDYAEKLIEYKKLEKGLSDSLFYGYKQVYLAKIPFIGNFLVFRVDLYAIYEANIPAFIQAITGKTVVELDAEIDLKYKKLEESNKRYEAKRKNEHEQSKAKLQVEIENLKKTGQVLTEYPKTGNFTLFYLKMNYKNEPEKHYIYLYDYKGKRYIEKKTDLFYGGKPGQVYPRKLKNKISLENFIKNMNKGIFFIESNSVIFG
jgi:hypothetical protein